MRCDAECDRHQVPQAAKTPDVAGMGLVIDDAGDHEQGRLEGGVIDDVEHRDHGRHGVPKPSSMVIRPRWLTVE